MKRLFKFVILTALTLVLNATYAGNGVCTNNNGILACKKETFVYGAVGFDRNDKGKWCITTKFTDGYPDMIDCVYSSKNECASDNPLRQYTQTRCVKNPKYSDDDE